MTATIAAPRTPATLAGLGAIALWSSLALLTVASEGLPPFQLLAVAFGIAGAAGLLACTLRGGDRWAGWRAPRSAIALTVAGLFGYHALYFFALKHAPALEANLINYLWPLLIVLFCGLLPGVRLGATHIAGAALGFAAAVLLVTRGRGFDIDPAHASGYLAALCAAVVWAAYSVLNRRHADVPGDAIVPACLAVAVLGALAHMALETTVVPTATQWLVLCAMGLGPVGAAFFLWDHGTKHGDLALLGTLSYLAPLLSTLLLVLAGRAQPHWLQAVALALLLCGAWLGTRGGRPGTQA